MNTLLNKRIKIVSISILFLSLSALLVFSAYPAISVSEKEIIKKIEPGEADKVTFSVKNIGDSPEEVRVLLKDWSLDQQGERVIYEPGQHSNSLSPFLSYSPKKFKLQPKESKQVTVNLSVKENRTGPHWSMFMVAGRPIKKVEQGNVNVRISAAYPVNIIQTDPGTYTKKGQISSLKVANKSKKKEVNVNFENTGTVPLEPAGRIEVRDLSGTTVTKLNISRFQVLPSGTRKITKRIDNLESGNYIVLAIVDFGGNYKVAKQKRFEVE